MQETHYEQIYESRVGADTLSNTNEPSAAALIRAQGQQLRKETVLEYWRGGRRPGGDRLRCGGGSQGEKCGCSAV